MSVSVRSIASVLIALTVVSAAAGANLSLREFPDRVTEAIVIVDAPPADIYQLVTDYANWPRWFSDVRSAKIVSGGRENGRVKFFSRAFGHEATVQFDNLPGRMIRLRAVKGPPGGRAWAEYLLVPIDGGRRTQVTARLHLDVVGLPGLFFSGKKLRAMRQAKLRADLADAERWAERRIRPLHPP